MPLGIEQQQCAGEKESYRHPALKRTDILRRDQANRKHPSNLNELNCQNEFAILGVPAIKYCWAISEINEGGVFIPRIRGLKA